MRPQPVLQRPVLTDDHGVTSREGRGCEPSHRATRMIFFPHDDARPGAWLLLLATVCTYVAVRALEGRLI